MKSRFTVLIAGAFALVVFASLPSVAAATTPEDELAAFPTAFSGTGGAAETRIEGSPGVNCLSSDVTGKLNNKTTGEIQITFTGCKETLFNSQCNSTGKAGEIQTLMSPFDLIYSTNNKTSPSVLVTPVAGKPFVTINCPLPGTKVIIEGNGVIGAITAPACGGTSNNFKVGFTAAGVTQSHKQITAAGVVYHLEANIGGALKEAALVTELSLSFAGGAMATLKCL